MKNSKLKRILSCVLSTILIISNAIPTQAGLRGGRILGPSTKAPWFIKYDYDTRQLLSTDTIPVYYTSNGRIIYKDGKEVGFESYAPSKEEVKSFPFYIRHIYMLEDSDVAYKDNSVIGVVHKYSKDNLDFVINRLRNYTMDKRVTGTDYIFYSIVFNKGDFELFDEHVEVEDMIDILENGIDKEDLYYKKVFKLKDDSIIVPTAVNFYEKTSWDNLTDKQRDEVYNRFFANNTEEYATGIGCYPTYTNNYQVSSESMIGLLDKLNIDYSNLDKSEADSGRGFLRNPFTASSFPLAETASSEIPMMGDCYPSIATRGQESIEWTTEGMQGWSPICNPLYPDTIVEENLPIAGYTTSYGPPYIKVTNDLLASSYKQKDLDGNTILSIVRTIPIKDSLMDIWDGSSTPVVESGVNLLPPVGETNSIVMSNTNHLIEVYNKKQDNKIIKVDNDKDRLKNATFKLFRREVIYNEDSIDKEAKSYFMDPTNPISERYERYKNEIEWLRKYGENNFRECEIEDGKIYAGFVYQDTDNLYTPSIDNLLRSSNICSIYGSNWEVNRPYRDVYQSLVDFLQRKITWNDTFDFYSKNDLIHIETNIPKEQIDEIDFGNSMEADKEYKYTFGVVPTEITLAEDSGIINSSIPDGLAKYYFNNKSLIKEINDTDDSNKSFDFVEYNNTEVIKRNSELKEYYPAGHDPSDTISIGDESLEYQVLYKTLKTGKLQKIKFNSIDEVTLENGIKYLRVKVDIVPTEIDATIRDDVKSELKEKGVEKYLKDLAKVKKVKYVSLSENEIDQHIKDIVKGVQDDYKKYPYQRPKYFEQALELYAETYRKTLNELSELDGKVYNVPTDNYCGHLQGRVLLDESIENLNKEIHKYLDSQRKPLELISDENGEIKLPPLEDGIYYLKEVKAPDNYNGKVYKYDPDKEYNFAILNGEMQRFANSEIVEDDEGFKIYNEFTREELPKDPEDVKKEGSHFPTLPNNGSSTSTPPTPIKPEVVEKIEKEQEKKEEGKKPKKENPKPDKPDKPTKPKPDKPKTKVPPEPLNETSENHSGSNTPHKSTVDNNTHKKVDSRTTEINDHKIPNKLYYIKDGKLVDKHGNIIDENIPNYNIYFAQAKKANRYYKDIPKVGEDGDYTLYVLPIPLTFIIACFIISRKKQK